MRGRVGWATAVGASAGIGTGVVCAAVALWLHWVRPSLPFPNASRLVEIVAEQNFSAEAAGTIVAALRGQPDLFDRVVVYKDNMGLSLPGDRLIGGNVGTIGAHDLLETLGVQPLLGRLPTPGEDLPGLGQSILLSEDFWRSRFGGDPDLLGTDIEFESRLGPVTVVGILPGAGLQLPILGSGGDFVLPLGNYGGENWLADVSLLARVAPGRSRADAVNWWQTVAPELMALTSERTSEVAPAFELRPFRGVEPGGRVIRTLTGLAAAAALALAVAILNVTVLSWLDALQRAQALAVHIALGASRWRVAFLLVRRCLASVVVGGASGVVGAWLVLANIRGGASENPLIPQVSWAAAAFALCVCVLFAAVGALWPLRPVLSLDMTMSLRREPGGWGGLGGGRLRSIAGMQIAVATTLLMVGALFESAVDAYASEDRGFDVADVSFGNVAPGSPTDGPGSAESVARLLADRGLAAAGLAVGDPPLSGHVLGFPRVVRAGSSSEPLTRRTWVAPISAAYPASLGIGLVEGRFFTDVEAAQGAPVALLDTATARALDQGSSLIGRTIDVIVDTAWVSVTVVGTVESVTLTDTRTRQQVHQVYVPFALAPTRDYSVLIDTRLASSAPTLVQRTLPGASVGPFTRFRDLHRSGAQTQVLAYRALGAAAGLGLTLAGVGLFAVLGHATERRRREFGVRQAVGASRSAVVWHSLRSGLTVAAVGLCLGLAAAVVAGRVLQSALLGVEAWDLGSLTLTTILVLSASLVACLRPALAAGRTDPLDLMRAE